TYTILPKVLATIYTLLQIIGFRCSNHLHGQAFVKEWIALRSDPFSEFKCGTMIGCYLCNKSIHEISLLLNIPRSTESVVKDLQSSSGLQISTATMRGELHGMGFHGRASASKPYSTKCNALGRM
ncbi:unnamed protein product, partial [Staurois parvus]